MNYELIDFGAGRKLESLGGYLINRPAPAASDTTRRDPSTWQSAGATYDEVTTHWQMFTPWPQPCLLDAGLFRLPLRPTPFGHIGAFPEQQPNWQWLARIVDEVQGRHRDRAVRALNLFAHTGGSTLAMASRGAAVTHVDAAKPNVTAAKQAAAASGLATAAIRYIVDDAMKLTAREVRRGRMYDVIVLDPPAYGHGPDGGAWRIERDLWPLIDLAAQLTAPGGGAMLVTGHSASLSHQHVRDYLKQHFSRSEVTNSIQIQCGRSSLADRCGRKLDTGFYVRAVWGDCNLESKTNVK